MERDVITPEDGTEALNAKAEIEKGPPLQATLEAIYMQIRRVAVKQGKDGDLQGEISPEDNSVVMVAVARHEVPRGAPRGGLRHVATMQVTEKTDVAKLGGVITDEHYLLAAVDGRDHFELQTPYGVDGYSEGDAKRLLGLITPKEEEPTPVVPSVVEIEPDLTPIHPNDAINNRALGVLGLSFGTGPAA